ncbi:neuromedin U receptor [Branchiostoma belcheri]|nr:neuromedin U receptor [Branchiostoma belcheri]
MRECPVFLGRSNESNCRPTGDICVARRPAVYGAEHVDGDDSLTQDTCVITCCNWIGRRHGNHQTSNSTRCIRPRSRLTDTPGVYRAAETKTPRQVTCYGMDVYSEQFGRTFRLMPNTTENFTWSLEDLFGPESAPLSIQIPLTIVYVITFMTGIMGNVLTMIIFTTVPSLRNPTNFYLLSLAFSDLLMLVINLPVDMTEQLFQKSWVLGDTVCRSHVFMNELCYSATVMSICTLSIERYIAICHPLQAKTLVTKERTMTAIVAEVSFRLPSGESVWAKCTIPLQYQEQVQYFTAVATVVFFVVPMCLLAGLYLLIGVKLHKTRSNPKSRRAGKLGRRADALINKTRGQAVKKLGLVVLAFAVCWTPYHALRLMYVYADMFGSTEKVVYLNMDYVSTVLLYLNSALNPVLYNLASKRFRHEFRVLLCKNRFKVRESHRSTRVPRSHTFAK